MAGGYQSTRQQVVRLDREPSTEIAPTTEDALLSRLTALIPRADAVIISDYGYGTVTSRVLAEVRALEERGVIVASSDKALAPSRATVCASSTANDTPRRTVTGP